MSIFKSTHKIPFVEASDDWEYIGNFTNRLKVHGGWLLRSAKSVGNETGPGAGCSVCLYFIEDKEHSWVNTYKRESGER
jgi:hypothetical protein